MFIYKITNTVNGKVYVGKTQNFKKRVIKHKAELNSQKHHNSYLQKSWNKHGSSVFSFEVVEQFNPSTCFDINNLERYWIKHYQANISDFGYNLTEGGEGTPGRIMTNETKLKIGKANKGRVTWAKGKRFTDEHRTKISNSNKGKKTKKVLDISTKVVFNSVKDAAFFCKINYATLKDYLNGRLPNKTTLRYLEQTCA